MELLDATYEHGIKRVLETLMGHSSAEQVEVLEQDIEGAALMASVDKVRENTSGLRDAPTSQ
ncbi:MAG: hypothetical protein MRQ09_04595 [Candidatus Midichloria sp.]|nr:hypothetical protein [Candidatus Midichloria sp.]